MAIDLCVCVCVFVCVCVYVCVHVCESVSDPISHSYLDTQHQCLHCADSREHLVPDVNTPAV